MSEEELVLRDLTQAFSAVPKGAGITFYAKRAT